MMGQHDCSEALFYYFRLEDQIPENHLLRLIEKYISFEFVRERLKDSYSDTGRPSVDPELLLRILLIGYLYGITSERKLVGELRMHLAWRWFTGLGFDQEIPHHSTFSNRHGRFQESKLFEQLVRTDREAVCGSGIGAGPAPVGRWQFRRSQRRQESHSARTVEGCRLSAGRTVSGASWYGAKRSANACEASCERSNSSLGCACTIRCAKPEDGCSRSSEATSITTWYPETSRVWGRSVTECWRYGGVLSAAGARNTGSRGRVLWPWLSGGFRNRARFIPFQMHALPPFI